MLEAEETLVIDVLQLGVPGADAGAFVVERVVGTGIVEAVAAGLALRHGTDHGLYLVVATFVAQTGGAQLPRLQGQSGALVGNQANALVGRR
ncbi:hypothetical protein D3C84_1091100 [compost metagenome]